MGKVLFIATVLPVVILGWVYINFFGDAEAPKLPEHYWGPRSKATEKEDVTIRPFKINIDDKVLNDLKTRLTLETSAEGNRLVLPLEGIGFQYGFNTIFLRNITNYWLNKYDWRAREKMLNKYPQFKTTINGIEIHFQHIKYTGTKKYKYTRPLLLLHGWPGSFIEFQKSIPALLEPSDSVINFELVIPSLPGFGFSESSYKPGLGPLEMGQILVKLMKRVGHERFYAQGGDWGSLITTDMAALYPENVVGLHINFCLSHHPRTFLRLALVSIYPELFMDKVDIPKVYPHIPVLEDILLETGYLHIQSTKPDTLGSAITNTPTGLAAYILEKFSTATNKQWREREDGGLGGNYFELDELIDNLMVYWVTNSITSSFRLYAEGFNKTNLAHKMNQVPVKIPTGCMSNPNEVVFNTPLFLQDKYHDLVHFTKSDKGGHFIAFEFPEIFAKDVIKFFNTVEQSKNYKF